MMSNCRSYIEKIDGYLKDNNYNWTHSDVELENHGSFKECTVVYTNHIQNTNFTGMQIEFTSFDDIKLSMMINTKGMYVDHISITDDHIERISKFLRTYFPASQVSQPNPDLTSDGIHAHMWATIDRLSTMLEKML